MVKLKVGILSEGCKPESSIEEVPDNSLFSDGCNINARSCDDERCEDCPSHWVTNDEEKLKSAFVHSSKERWARQHVGATSNPETVRINSRFRPFCDGGGLCSPGRWHPEHRGTMRLPHYRSALQNFVCEHSLGEKLRYAAVTGFRDSPWKIDHMVTAVHDGFDVARSIHALPKLDRTLPKGQPFYTKLLGTILKEAGDPDWEFVASMADDGVSMGVDEPLPRTPSVFRKKTRWRLNKWTGDCFSTDSNYKSGEEFADIIREKLLEEVPLGRVLCPMSLERRWQLCASVSQVRSSWALLLVLKSRLANTE